MTTYINQGRGRLKIESIETPNGTEIGISQPISFDGAETFVEVRVSLDSLPRFIDALINEQQFLRPTTVGTGPTQGQLFDPDKLEVQ